MYEIGRLAVKIAGRDAGKHCVILDVVDSLHVLIDGETRRRVVNLKHIEPLETVLDLDKRASHENVTKEFAKLNFKVWDTKKKEKKARPRKSRKVKLKPVKKAPPKKVAVKEVKQIKEETQKIEAKKESLEEKKDKK